ncbi:hypothetical protein FOZ61_010550 [Perkinsus olseni]|uniref:Uncharacterized protein n=1 Tax=Perkinsus olseni TaxID=32597 RepID=A0A7J6M2D2_PEROL|nr:hypothetical protein FOZ61_010550 [Perkinsus olseni]
MGRRIQFQMRRMGQPPAAASMQPDTASGATPVADNTTATSSASSKSLNGWTKMHSETISREPFNNFIDTGEPGRIWSAGLQSTTIAAFREYISKRVKPGSQADTEQCNWAECALYACGYCEMIEGSVYCPNAAMTGTDGAMMVGEVKDFCVINPEAKNSEFSGHSCREALNLGPGEMPPAVSHANQSDADSAFSGENPTVMDSLAAKPGDSLLNRIAVTAKGHVMCSGMVFHFVPERTETPNDAHIASSSPMLIIMLVISSLIVS